MQLRGLVAAVLAPHHRVHGELEAVRVALEDPLDAVDLVVGESERAGQSAIGHAVERTATRSRAPNRRVSRAVVTSQLTSAPLRQQWGLIQHCIWAVLARLSATWPRRRFQQNGSPRNAK